MLEVLDSLRRLLDSPQRILSHVRLDSTHGTSRTAMPADEGKRRCAAAEKAWRVRLRQAVSAAETAAAQNEPLADEQQRVLATPAPHTPPHHHYFQHYAAQQQLEQQRQQEWLSSFEGKWGFQRLDRAAAFTRRRGFKAQRRWRFF